MYTRTYNFGFETTKIIEIIVADNEENGTKCQNSVAKELMAVFWCSKAYSWSLFRSALAFS